MKELKEKVAAPVKRWEADDENGKDEPCGEESRSESGTKRRNEESQRRVEKPTRRVAKVDDDGRHDGSRDEGHRLDNVLAGLEDTGAANADAVDDE